MLGSLSQRVGSESTLALAADRVDLSPCVARQARCPTSPHRRSILCFLCLLCLLPATRLFLQTERKAWRFPNSLQPQHPLTHKSELAFLTTARWSGSAATRSTRSLPALSDADRPLRWFVWCHASD